MTLLLSDADVRRACDFPSLVKAMETGLQGAHGPGFAMPPRTNLGVDGTFLRVMPAIMSDAGILGLKMFYGSTERGVGYIVVVCDAATGQALALVDGAYLTAARTGATSGVATKYLARPDSRTVGVIGSGVEARTNLLSVAAVRPLEKVTVYSRTESKRAAFAEEMARTLGIDVVTASSAADAVRGTDIVIVATNTGSGGPVAYNGDCLEPGQHVVSIGSTTLQLREVDVETFTRADLVCFDTSPSVVAEESGDVAAWLEFDGAGPDSVTGLGDLIRGAAPGRTAAEQITVFKSVGTAAQDLVGAFVVYETALNLGIGAEVPSIVDLRTF